MTFFTKLKDAFADWLYKALGDDSEGLLTQADFTAGRLYCFVLLCVAALVMCLAVLCAKQTQVRYNLYTQLVKAQAHYHTLKTEEQQLIIEQQTYSSIPIVAKRATNQLNMYYPIQKDRIVIVPPSTPTQANSEKTQ